MQQFCYKLLSFLFFLPLCATAQQAGDLAFVGFNADGNDDFAVVTFVDLAPNTILYFRDSEWNGTAFGADEQVFAWNTGATVIPAGAVIGFNNMSAASTVTRGIIPSNVGMGLAASGEAIFIYRAVAADSTPTIIAAIGNGDVASSFGTLNGTGLVAGSTAILLAPAGTDVATYKGPRSGLNKNSYLAALNNIAANWDVQDGTGDQHNDGITPDLPFNLNPFTFGTGGDVTAPTVVSVTIQSNKIWAIRFSEAVNATSAVATANYQIVPTLTIDSLRYNPSSNTVLLYQSGMANAVDYRLTVNGVRDTSGNVMAPYTSPRLVFNNTKPKLLFTEIMYNAGDNLDSLEFFEIINAGTDTALLGGLTVRDVTNGSFGQINVVLPSIKLAPDSIILIASFGRGANNFYKRAFIDLNFVGNALSNGGESLLITNSLGAAIDSVAYDDVLPWPTAADGQGPSLERKTLEGASNDPNNWQSSIRLAGKVGTINIFASPGIFTPVRTAAAAFIKTHTVITEGVTDLSIPIRIDVNPDRVVEVRTIFSLLTTGTQDVIFLGSNVGFKPDSTREGNIFLKLRGDNATPQPDRYVYIVIDTVINGKRGALSEHIVYIKDNDQPLITPTKEVELQYASSFAIGDGGSAEIVAFDSISNRLFVVNSTQNKLEILNFNGPKSVSKFKTIDMAAYGIGLQSVAVRNGLVAVAVDVANFGNGKVVFFNANGDFQKQVEVGNLPDMLTFTPDGKRVLTANEGQPNQDYTIDPEGTVSVINLPNNIADLKQTDVTTIRFNDFDGRLNQLRDSGVRIYGKNATVSKDVEPEYIAVSADGRTAWVTLQENNAFGIIDLQNLRATNIVPLGFKDYSQPGNTLDASDRTDSILLANYPVFGMYQPDAIAPFQIGNQTFLITANEGDAREYDALEEEVAFGSAAFRLDSLAFPNGNILKSPFVLGRLNVVNTLGDADGDGDFDAAYTLGGRSFSIWNANGNLVYDSGDRIERITAADPTWKGVFNANNSGANARKNRSDNKGPEPEGVTITQIGGQTFAFVALERTGGIMTFNVTNPTAPTFVQYVNSRTLGAASGGDLGPEGLIYLTPAASPNDTAMLVVANEISGTLSFYQLSRLMTDVDDVTIAAKTMIAFPNPAQDVIYLEQESDYRLYDLQGKMLQKVQRQDYMNISQLSKGIYVVVRKDGALAKVVKQ